jgi:small conductance mechanosensitive channel
MQDTPAPDTQDPQAPLAGDDTATQTGQRDDPPPQNLADTIQHYGPSIVSVIVILLIAWIAARWSRRAIRVALLKTRLDVTLVKFISNLSRWAIIIVAILLCLDIFGVRTTSFAAIIGAVVLAIGLGFQGSLAHFASGLMLLIFRPFKVGDLVSVAGQFGKINEIDLFFTELDTPDGKRVIIPNGQIFGNVIENITHHPRRRVDTPVAVHYEADIDQTRAALERALAMIEPKLADPAPEVILQELGDSSVNWQLRVWTRREEFFATRQASVRAAKYALENAGITIPFPQMDVHLRFPNGTAPLREALEAR